MNVFSCINGKNACFNKEGKFIFLRPAEQALVFRVFQVNEGKRDFCGLGAVQTPNFFIKRNLKHRTQHMKSSGSESIRNACFNLERLSRSVRLARLGISPLEQLWNYFDSDAELFMYRT